MQTHYGFVWDSDAIWSNPDATKNGTVVERDVLTGSTAGTLWDFNNGLQGWTVSSSTFVGHWTNTCGVNGTSGGSIKTQANFNAPHHATSPTINLAGAPTMPLTHGCYRVLSPVVKSLILEKICRFSISMQQEHG